MSAYTIYKELFPSQTVEHVEQAHFTAPDVVNLIVAKASLLQIYNFVEYTPIQQNQTTQTANNTGDGSKDNDDDDDIALSYPTLIPLDNDIAATRSGRLELVAQYNLNGQLPMGAIRTCSPRGKEGCDSLLLGFEDAKVN
ncbi:unnamed protein product [Absidia cylindrospora]